MIRRRIARLFLPAFLVLFLTAVLAWLLHTEPGARWLWSQASTRVPGTLHAVEVSGSLQSGLILRQVVFENESSKVQAEMVRLQLAVDLFPPALAVESLAADRGRIHTLAAVDTPGGNSRKHSLSALALPFPIHFGRVQVEHLVLLDDSEAPAFDARSVYFSGRWHEKLSSPDAGLQLSAKALQWPVGNATAGVQLQAVNARFTGTPQRYQLVADATLQLEGLPPAKLLVQAAGDTRGMRLDSLQLGNDIARLQASGTLAWADGLQLKLASAVESLDLRPWFADWPGDQPLHGMLAAGWQGGRIEFENVDLSAGDSGFQFAGKGVFDPALDTLTAELDWTSLNWPLGASQVAFRSDRGRMRVTGRPDQWTMAGTLDLQGGDWPRGVLTLTGKGNRESAALNIEQGQVLGGHLAGEFNYQWTGHQPWSARIQAEALDIAPLAGAYPGTLSATVSAAGQAEPLQVDMDIEELHGRIRGQPVQAKGGLAFAAGQIHARDLRLVSGASHVLLDGSARDQEGIRFSGHIESLASFVEGAEGSLSGEGRLSLDPGHPLITLDLQGQNLRWGRWRADAIAATPQGGEEKSAGRIDITGLVVNERVFEKLSLKASGSTPLELLEFEARAGDTQLQARLAGSILHWAEPSSTKWSGRLEAMSVNHQSFGSLVLERPVNVSFGAAAVQLEPACFRGSANGITCFDAVWNAGGTLLANASLDSVSLNLVRLYLPAQMDFSQRMSGEIHWLEAPGEQTSADVRIELSPGVITAADGAAELNTGPGVFAFKIQHGQLLAGDLDVSLPGAGRIDADFNLPDISQGANSPLAGRVEVMLDNIEPFADWIPALDSLAGHLSAELHVAGTAADPALTGYATLVRGRVGHAASGVTLSDIQLAGAVYETNHTQLNGSFTSGAGRGRLKAEVKFDKILKPEISLEFTGQDLTLVNVPDMTVKANPDLRVKWRDGAVELDGSILIPSARISPRYLPTTNAGESPDLVVVSGEKPLRRESAIDSSRLRVNGNVVVELGQDVTVSFERAKARLSGKSTFSWNDQLIPVGDGGYTVSGKISAYGQRLEVAEGRVNFPRVPANNPHLNITAERQIYGNVRVKKAGVRITGTLKRPVMETYTSPATTEERALALLVTGHDFDYDQGVGAVEVGLYIAPKLYVSYGIGLFEPQSVISVRYDLKHGFGIKATSGQRETGADISYTIER